MKSELFQNKLIVKQSPLHGYGVFAAQTIETGEVIEECTVILTKNRYSELNNFYFPGASGQYWLALGYGSLYNHSSKENADVILDREHNLIYFKAKRLIEAGEEIVISYGKDWFSSRNMMEKELGWRARMGLVLKSARPWVKGLLVLALYWVVIRMIRV